MLPTGESQLRALREAIDKEIGDITRSVVLTTLQELLDTSPVDTGWFRANWIPSIGSGVTGAEGSREAVSTAAQIAGRSAVLRYRKPSQGPITMANHVPYGVHLNAGSSAQAPAQFVEAAIEKSITLVLAFGSTATEG